MNKGGTGGATLGLLDGATKSRVPPMPEAKECITGRDYIVIRGVGTWAMRPFSTIPDPVARVDGEFFREGA